MRQLMQEDGVVGLRGSACRGADEPLPLWHLAEVLTRDVAGAVTSVQTITVTVH